MKSKSELIEWLEKETKFWLEQSVHEIVEDDIVILHDLRQIVEEYFRVGENRKEYNPKTDPLNPKNKKGKLYGL